MKNQALKTAVGRYCVQLNPDTLIRPGAFDALADFMDAHPEAGSVYTPCAQSGWLSPAAMPAQ